VKRNCVQGTDVSYQQLRKLACPQVHIHCILNEFTDFWCQFYRLNKVLENSEINSLAQYTEMIYKGYVYNFLSSEAKQCGYHYCMVGKYGLQFPELANVY